MKAFLEENLKHVSEKYKKWKLSDIQWNIGSAQLPLSQMVIDKKIPHFADILDIACGAWQNSIMLALNYMNVVSFDIMEDILIKTKKFFDMHNLDIKLFKADLLKMPFCDNSFDVALDSFIYHDLKVDARIPYIKEVYRVLRPGGKFIFFSFSDYMEKKTSPWPERVTACDIQETILKYFECEELRIFDNFPTIDKPNQKHWFGIFNKPISNTKTPKAFNNKSPKNPIRWQFYWDIDKKIKCVNCDKPMPITHNKKLQCTHCHHVFKKKNDILWLII